MRSDMTKAPKEKDPNRLIRAVVIGMGLVLIAGTILLFVFAVQKMSEKAKEASDPRSVIPRDYRDCGDHRVSLAEKFPLSEIELKGSIARVVQRTANGGAVITLIHLCSGEKLGSVTLDVTRPSAN